MLIAHIVDAAQAYLAAPDPGEAPNPAPAEIPGLGPVADMFLGWGKWALLVGGVLGMFICGGMMILGRRNRSATAVDGATGIPWVLGGLTIAAIGATVVSTVL
ncbi:MULTISPECIES: hypothetical protein [Asanoa]|uniref:Uncharacterized protein n=2 Tax=Asanoa TaxID=195964 RepID=A0A239PGG9_9ACTN|nr:MULTISPECIES: hypothetical protein [Asanoa]GIF74182.1 hypothetical protein Asi02nite_37000 [Asanoa siamensis]SNT65698.1 hypothetical protein SAMN05421812_12541 [Asanoa hainanensis]